MGWRDTIGNGERAELFYKELLAEMRSRRDNTWKIASIFFQVSAFVLAANIALMVTSSVKNALLITVVVISAFFILLVWFLVDRLVSNNRNYSDEHGQRVQFLNKLWGTEDVYGPLPPGKGPGARLVLIMIRGTTAFVIVALIAGVITKMAIESAR